jgi:hypothetical protein
MSDPANDVEWRAGSRIAEWASDGPIGVGSLMRSEDRSMGRKIETYSEITSWDPPHGYGFKSKSSSFPAEFNFNLVAEGDGTLLTAQGKIEFKGIYKLMEWISRGQIEKQVEDDSKTEGIAGRRLMYLPSWFTLHSSCFNTPQKIIPLHLQFLIEGWLKPAEYPIWNTLQLE